MSNLYTQFLAFITAVIAFISSLFGLPYYPTGEKLNITRFTQTFSEDFTDGIDQSIWSGHYQYGNTSAIRRGGWWNKNLAYTENGSLVIPVEYYENGYGGGAAGWYSAGIDTDGDNGGGFSQKYGYFEVRCILPEGADIWAAFWLMNDGVYNEDGNGCDGTEIDVFESPYYGDKKSNCVSSNLHYDGYNEAHEMLGAQKYLIKGNPYKEFNTYGVEWNENEYIFYINGTESLRTSYGGVSQNAEYLILSVEISGNDGIYTGTAPAQENSRFIVDYVKAYQYN